MVSAVDPGKIYEENMSYQFVTALEKELRARFEKFPADLSISLERCPAGMNGDFAVNCFRFAKFCGRKIFCV